VQAPSFCQLPTQLTGQGLVFVQAVVERVSPWDAGHAAPPC